MFCFSQEKSCFRQFYPILGFKGGLSIGPLPSLEALKGLLNQCTEGFLEQGRQIPLRIALTECVNWLGDCTGLMVLFNNALKDREPSIGKFFSCAFSEGPCEHFGILP